MKHKKRKSPTSVHDLQIEVGRLQQENEDLRRQVKEQAGLIVGLEKHYRDQAGQQAAEIARLQTLISAGIRIPKVRP